MRTEIPSFRRLAMALSLGLALPFSTHAEDATAAAAVNGNQPASAVDPRVPQSVFVVPAKPSEGRDPFFPRSKRGQPRIDRKEVQVPDTSSLVLNGISGPPKRTVIINGKTFEEGEAGEIRVPNGAKLRVKVKEIKEEAAVVFVGNQRLELRLRGSL